MRASDTPVYSIIARIHMEEDAGKLVHQGATITTSAGSLADYNRAGVPLIEIVSERQIWIGEVTVFIRVFLAAQTEGHTFPVVPCAGFLHNWTARI